MVRLQTLFGDDETGDSVLSTCGYSESDSMRREERKRARGGGGLCGLLVGWNGGTRFWHTLAAIPRSR